MAVQDVILKESEVGSIPDNKETPDLLDDGSELGIWHPDDGHQDDDNRERQDTSTDIKEEWHDAGSVNTQETTLRQEASDVGETALDEGSTATRGSHRDSESLEDSDTEDFSQLETVGFNEDALEHEDRAEPRRGTRARNVPQFFGEVGTHLAVTEGDYVEPKTVYETKQGDDWDQWHRAMKDEVKALQDNETWNLVRAPTDRDVIPGKWVYKVKLGPSGQVDKYEARFSALTNRGRSVSGTATGVCKTQIRWEKLVCRLNKSIYGLKQAANRWYKELANFLLRQGFTISRNDHCLFAKSEAEDHTFILVRVDDIMVASRSMTVVCDVKKALETTFHMGDRGRLHWLLGLRIRREEGKVTVYQERYIETMLERFQMDQCKPSGTPAD